MKINTLNYIAEERKMAEFALFLEKSGIFDKGTDLEEIPDDPYEGLKVLEAIAAGNGDELSQEQVDMAKTSWLSLRKLLDGSMAGLREQVRINKMITANDKKEDNIEMEIN